MNIKIGPVNISVTLGNLELERLFKTLGDELMSKLDPIKAAVVELKAAVSDEISRVEASFKALKDAIDAGTVSDADVQAVVDDIKSAKAMVDAEDPAPVV